MPLPRRIFYVDQERNIKEQAVKTQESGYQPTPEYHPTMKVVRCGTCGTVGICEFVNGFNLSDGDKLMAGKPILGICFRCQKETELVPIPNLSAADENKYKMLYRIQATLDEAARRGEKMNPNGIIWPMERIKKYDEARLRASQEKPHPGPDQP